jgi:hypothetical protein
VKKNFLLRGLLLVAVCVAWAGCKSVVTKPKSTVEPVGDNTYALTLEGGSAWDRDMDALKARAQQSAQDYCTNQSKQFKLLTITAEKPLLLTGYASATVTFKALNAGDPELTAEPSAPAMATAAPRPAPPSDTYAKLIRLDELRKKGILSEEEFQAEKQKILSHADW